VESVTKHCPAVQVPAHVEGVHGGAPPSELPLRELEQPIETVPTASTAANRKKDKLTRRR
jgi:hypothetical protein